MRSVLITGASRGIGQAVALRQAAAGWDVYAGVRDTGSGQRLVSADARITPVELDVTNEAQIASLPQQLPQRLDAVVNNAGTALLGPIEALSLGDLRQQMEVNLIGQVAVTQAVLPMLRASEGRAVFLSSVNGRMSVPMEGAYCASKFALEGLVDALRVELRPWRISVSLVEPGPVDTGPWREIHGQIDGMEQQMTPEHHELYAGHTAGLRRSASRLQGRTMSADRAARVVQRALTAKRPRGRYVVGGDARAMIAMQAVIPTRALDAASARIGGWK